MKYRHPEVSCTGETSQAQMTADAGSSAVTVRQFTTADVPCSSLKAGIVAYLAGLFDMSPVLAIALAHVVRACWPGFKGA